MSKELKASIQDIEWISLKITKLVQIFRDASFNKKLSPVDYADYGELISHYAHLLEMAGEEVRHGGIEEEV